VVVENLKAQKATRYKSNLARIEWGFEFNELARLTRILILPVRPPLLLKRPQANEIGAFLFPLPQEGGFICFEVCDNN
jgi:hypothetical protein